VKSFSISEAGTLINLPLAAVSDSKALRVTLITDGPPAPEELKFPPFDRRVLPQAFIIVVAPHVVDAAGKRA
jgi:hypothetical protein